MGVENEISLRITQFVWRVSRELKIVISKDAVVSDITYANGSRIVLNAQPRSLHVSRSRSVISEPVIVQTPNNSSTSTSSIVFHEVDVVNVQFVSIWCEQC